MCGGPNSPDGLSNLSLPQFFDNPGSNHKGDEHGGDGGIGGPKGDVAEDVEKRNLGRKRIE